MKRAALHLSLFFLFAGCAHTSPVYSQAYASLSNHRNFEFEFPVVWKGIEDALRNNKVIDRSPDEVSVLEMKKLDHRTLETDWIYTQSRDKYQEYTSNGFPKKKYLQVRYKYSVDAKRTMGGVDVNVKTSEEIEKLHDDGGSAGFSSAQTPDPSRASELLDRIGNQILSAAP